MRRVDPGDLVLMDFIPACARHRVLFRCHEQRRQVAGEGEALIEDEGNTVIAVTRCGNDLSVDAEAGKERPAVLEFQNEVIVLRDLDVRKLFPFEKLDEWSDEI